ncbi:Rgg family transcriptional regulator [Furfurilactobacillus entadae]|uniref:Rgg family transcriptional regulator n=1 Tax=Furfurilactobacillus entadae TaxID=2922307 RepID=UPI0035E4D384
MISRSEYYRVIRNERDISESHFHQLLINLNISTYEFELIRQGESPLFITLFEKIETAFDNQDIHSLKQIASRAADNFLETHYIRYRHIYILATALEQKVQLPSRSSKQATEIAHYLLLQNGFSMYDILLFSNSLVILSREIINILLKNILNSLCSYENFPYQISQLFHLIENLCMLNLKENRPISSYVELLKTVHLTRNQASEKLILQFFSKLADYESHPTTQNLNNIKSFLDSIKSINLTDQEYYFEDVYILFMKKYNHQSS